MPFTNSLSFIILYTLSFSISRIFVSAATAAGTETLIGITGNGFVLLASDGGISSNGVAFTSTYTDKIHQLQPNSVFAAAGDAADTDRIVSLLRAECNIYNFENFGTFGNGVEVIDCSTTHDGNTDTALPISPKATDLYSSLLPVDSIAQMARHKIAERLRSSAPLQVCGLIAGVRPIHSDSPQHSHTVAQHIQQQLMTVTSSLQKSENSEAKKSESVDQTEVSTSAPLLFWLDEYGSLIENVPYGVHGYAADMLWSILDNGYQPNMNLSKALCLLKECIRQLKTRYVINSQSQKFCIKYLDAHGCHVIDANAVA